MVMIIYVYGVDMAIKDKHIEEIEKIISCDDSILDDIVHETVSVQATNINNDGVYAQIEFLIGEGIYEDSEEVLEYIKVCYEDSSD